MRDEELTRKQVERVALERPDLIPLLRRIIVEGDGYYPSVPEADMDYLVSVGLLEKEDLRG